MSYGTYGESEQTQGPATQACTTKYPPACIRRTIACMMIHRNKISLGGAICARDACRAVGKSVSRCRAVSRRVKRYLGLFLSFSSRDSDSSEDLPAIAKTTSGIPFLFVDITMEKKEGMSMWKSFEAMPIFLKLFVGSAIVFPLFIVSSLIQTSMNVFGCMVSREAWWNSGGGPLVVVIGVFVWSSTIQFLRRSSSGRLPYVVAWGLMALLVPLMAFRLGISFESVQSPFFSSLVFAVLIAIYLYGSKPVRRYFSDL